MKNKVSKELKNKASEILSITYFLLAHQSRLWIEIFLVIELSLIYYNFIIIKTFYYTCIYKVYSVMDHVKLIIKNNKVYWKYNISL